MPGAFQKAFQLMRSGRPGPVLLDLPIDVQMAEIEFDIDAYEPLAVEKPKASRKQLEKALDMLTAGRKDRFRASLQANTAERERHLPGREY